MSDPLRTDPSGALDAASAADRDGRIEALLLAGLDAYFAGQYTDAINIWTRALFLDRTHPRARAYIERARSALAERQRQSEELLQTGVAAFSRGDDGEARRLLRAAIDSGAPADEAFALLDRLDRRLDGAPPAAPLRGRQPVRSVPDASTIDQGRSRRALAAATIALAVVAVIGAIGAASWVLPRLLFGGADASATNASPIGARDRALPLPLRGETGLTRARTLATNGHLRDALAVLDTIPPTDMQRPEVDRLRADIQRQLLGLAAATDEAPRPQGAGGPSR